MSAGQLGVNAAHAAGFAQDAEDLLTTTYGDEHSVWDKAWKLVLNDGGLKPECYGQERADMLRDIFEIRTKEDLTILYDGTGLHPDEYKTNIHAFYDLYAEAHRDLIVLAVAQAAKPARAPPKVAGYLRLSEKQKRKNSKGQELFKFVPLASQTQLSEHFPGFDRMTTVTLPSAAASRMKTSATQHLPDQYALVTLLPPPAGAVGAAAAWSGRVEELLGSASDFPSCATAQAYARGLMDHNCSLVRKPNPHSAPASASLPQPPAPSSSGSGSGVGAGLRVPAVVDLRDMGAAVFSIDPPGCVDIDDAIHIMALPTPTDSGADGGGGGGDRTYYEVGVHIADVVNYLKQTEAAGAGEEGEGAEETEVEEGAKGAGRGVKSAGAAKVAAEGTAKGSKVSGAGRLERIVSEALHRCFTVYLPTSAPGPGGEEGGQKQVPILPQYLAHEACSLQQGQDRTVLSCVMTLSVPAEEDRQASGISGSGGSGNGAGANQDPEDWNSLIVHGYRFQRSLVRSTAACSYQQVDRYLAQIDGVGGGKDVERTGTEAGMGLARLVKGALRLLRKVFPSIDSHKLVERLMLLANARAAQFMEDRHRDAKDGGVWAVPYVLRRQLPAQFNAAVEGEGEGGDGAEGVAEGGEWGKGGLELVREGCDQVPPELMASPAQYIFCGKDLTHGGGRGESTYSAEEKAHVSLGLGLYAHFTSPIRRAADQLVHCAISHALMAQERQMLGQTQGQGQALTGVTGSTGGTDTAVMGIEAEAAEAEAADPWLHALGCVQVEALNSRQRQHKKFSRDLATLTFVFAQCAMAGREEVTLSMRAVVLPFRLSQKHLRYKTDLYILLDQPSGGAGGEERGRGFVYPLRLHTTAQQQLLEVQYSAQTVSVRSRAGTGGDRRVLRVGEEVQVLVHLSKAAPTLRKKCAISAPCLSFL